jgi:hypothetical protein
MTLELTLPQDLEERLHQEAARRGQSADAVAVQLLQQHLPPALDARRTAAIALLHQWMEEDAALSAADEAANADTLRRLDADRPSYRKLFGDVLEDDRP